MKGAAPPPGHVTPPNDWPCLYPGCTRRDLPTGHTSCERHNSEAQQEIAAVLRGDKRWCVVGGDCLELMRAMPDKCGVVYSDPPYAVGKAIVGDKMTWEEWLPYWDARIKEMTRIGRLCFVFFANTKVIRFIRETTVPPQFEVNWHKPMMLHDTSLNGSPFLSHSEKILYWGPMSPKEAGKLGYDSFAVNAMWPRERREQGIDHPTPKPPALLELTIPHWSREDEIIIDPACGSGTHLIAALRTGRRTIGIDIDPRWVAHARERIEADLAMTSLGDIRRGQGALFT